MSSRQMSDMRTFGHLSVSVAIVAVFVIAESIANAAEEDDWEGRDKNLHLIAGIVIGSSVTAYTRSPATGVLAGVTMGVLKEITDRESENHIFSVKDLAATTLGAIAGSYVTGLIITPGTVSYRWKW